MTAGERGLAGEARQLRRGSPCRRISTLLTRPRDRILFVAGDFGVWRGARRGPNGRPFPRSLSYPMRHGQLRKWLSNGGIINTGKIASNRFLRTEASVTAELRKRHWARKNSNRDQYNTAQATIQTTLWLCPRAHTIATDATDNIKESPKRLLGLLEAIVSAVSCVSSSALTWRKPFRPLSRRRSGVLHSGAHHP